MDFYHRQARRAGVGDGRILKPLGLPRWGPATPPQNTPLLPRVFLHLLFSTTSFLFDPREFAVGVSVCNVHCFLFTFLLPTANSADDLTSSTTTVGSETEPACKRPRAACKNPLVRFRHTCPGVSPREIPRGSQGRVRKRRFSFLSPLP